MQARLKKRPSCSSQENQAPRETDFMPPPLSLGPQTSLWPLHGRLLSLWPNFT